MNYFFTFSFIDIIRLIVIVLYFFLFGQYLLLSQDSKKSTLKEKAEKEISNKLDTKKSATLTWEEIEKINLEKLKKNPNNIKSLYHLGLCNFYKKDFESALKYFYKVVKLDKRNEKGLLAIAQIYYSRDQNYMALSYVAKAVEISKKNPRSRNFLAIIFKKLGWDAAAEDELLLAIDLDPSYAEAHHNLAFIYMSQKPRPLELIKRHYYTSIDLGYSKNNEIEEFLTKHIENSN